MDWALEYAPPMPSQLVATLAGLARHADKLGRGAYPSVARLAAYTCKSPRSVHRDLVELRKLGLIRLGDQSKAAHLPEGKRPEVYDLAMERVVPEGRASSDGVTRASLVTLTSSRARGGRRKPTSDAMSSGLTPDAHVTSDAHVTPDVGVADGVTPTSRRGDAHVTQTQQMNQLPEPKESSSAPAVLDDLADGDLFDALEAKSAAIHKQREGEDLSAFAAFWQAYPKKRNKAEALDAWKKAIAAGVDPKHITEAATAYHRERHGEDPKYTKFPATWLNKGCYDDEPDEPARAHLRAVSGGHAPYRNPEDDSVYDESW